MERFVANYRELLPLCDAVLVRVLTLYHADIVCGALGAGINEGRAALQLALAILQSARSGQVVQVEAVQRTSGVSQ